MKLTDEDIDALRNLIKITIDESLEEKLNEKLKYFPSKDEFFSRMDKLMKEVKDSREEQTIISHKSSDNRDRIEKIEEILNITSA